VLESQNAAHRLTAVSRVRQKKVKRAGEIKSGAEVAGSEPFFVGCF
jgi:hypothetical protein